MPFKATSPPPNQFINLQNNNYIINYLDNKQFNSYGESAGKSSPTPTQQPTAKGKQEQSLTKFQGSQPAAKGKQEQKYSKAPRSDGQPHLASEAKPLKQQSPPGAKSLAPGCGGNQAVQASDKAVQLTAQAQQQAGQVNLGTHSSQLRNLQFHKQNQYFSQNQNLKKMRSAQNCHSTAQPSISVQNSSPRQQRPPDASSQRTAAHHSKSQNTLNLIMSSQNSVTSLSLSQAWIPRARAPEMDDFSYLIIIIIIIVFVGNAGCGSRRFTTRTCWLACARRSGRTRRRA